jgi:hypothetical protein
MTFDRSNRHVFDLKVNAAVARVEVPGLGGGHSRRV